MDATAEPQLRGLPQVQRLLETPAALALVACFGRQPVVLALRSVLDETRRRIRAGGAADLHPAALVQSAGALLEPSRPARLGRVINATGIVLHTNLGRAPLAREAAAAVAAVAAGYCNLEYDLLTGQRGSRTQGIEALLRRLTGAQAGLAVNNCAAAVLLALSGLAAGGEVVVSRGELVEIGGGFRIPDVIQQGGARLLEVGTTNKTRLADYAAAITPATRVLLKVHRSNFRLTGFTGEPSLAELAGLAAERALLLVHDLGSGAVTGLKHLGVSEPTVQDSIAAGADVVAFSGDKLLGGPQAGLLAGRADPIGRLARHPLLRALRMDKLSLAALEATLRLHCEGASGGIPALRSIGQGRAALQRRADRLAALLGPVARTAPTVGFAGGGTLPDVEIPSVGITLSAAAPDALAGRLRGGSPPVIGRIVDGCVLLDMLTVDDDEAPDLARAVQAALLG